MKKFLAQHRINQKADKKLRSIAECFQDTIPKMCKIRDDQFLHKIIMLNHCSPLEEIILDYDVENRFAAISYNLMIQSFLEKEEAKDYQFKLQYQGLLKIQNAMFDCETDKDKYDKREKEVLEVLNDSLIIKKIMELNLLEILVRYSCKERKWKICIKSMIGSSTWILIPPVMHTIVPKSHEIYTLLEVMRMLQSAIK